MANRVEQLEAMLNSSNPIIRENAEKELKRLESIGSAQLQVAAQSTSNADEQVAALLAGLAQAVKSSAKGISPADLRQAVSEELKARKITENDLSPSLLASLKSSRPVNVMLRTMKPIVSQPKQVDALMVNREIVQLVLSDLEARNNVYLYGGAGTGKTYLAEFIAGLLNWEKIILNCNQFTSPLDILGGQTIEGYQEGKLSMAWSNIITNPDGSKKKVDGCVLILDELPKIDPNTAGILNEALAKVKDFKYDAATDTYTPPTIRNGKNEVLPLGNLFVIATGNVALNTIDASYEANFKQDLSLQDRFIGSTYKVYVDYDFEFNAIMKGYAFLFIFFVKVRQAIEKARGEGQAFVSLRLMLNARETYYTYREIKSNAKGNLITRPKTVVETCENFFGLFKPSTKDAILSDVDFEGFKQIVMSKDDMPFDPEKPNFDTPQELAEVERIIQDYKSKQKAI